MELNTRVLSSGQGLGDQLIIVYLTMSMEERRARVLQRHSGDEASADMMDVSGFICLIIIYLTR